MSEEQLTEDATLDARQEEFNERMHATIDSVIKELGYITEEIDPAAAVAFLEILAVHCISILSTLADQEMLDVSKEEIVERILRDVEEHSETLMGLAALAVLNNKPDSEDDNATDT